MTRTAQTLVLGLLLISQGSLVRAEITHLPAPTWQSIVDLFYPDRAPAYFNNTDVVELYAVCSNEVANGSLVTVAQIESRLAGNSNIISGKTMTYHYDSDGTNDLQLGINDHANLVAAGLYSSYDVQYQATYTAGLAPGVGQVHGFTTDAYREVLDGPSTLGADGIDLVNISNTMGCGCEEARIRKHDKMLADENILAFHAHPASGPGSFSHTAWNGLVIGNATAKHPHSGPLTAYENVLVDSIPFQRQAPTLVSSDARFGVFGSASSFTTPTVASGGAMLMDYARSVGDSNAAHNLSLKAILLTGATKDLPGDAAYAWSQTSDRPLDPQMGAGLFNILNAYEIIQQPQSGPGGWDQRHYGWDLSEVQAALPQDYDFELTHDGQFIASLCWHRVIANDLLSFSVADLALTLDQWNDIAGTWDGVFSSDNAGENLEHITQPVSAGRYRLRVQSADAELIQYGLAWRFDPYEAAIQRTLVDTAQISTGTSYVATFTVPVTGDCVAVATPDVFVASPGIALLLERDSGGGAWELVHEADGLFSSTDAFHVPVTPGDYRITVTSAAPTAHDFDFSYRIDPDPISDVDAAALVANLLPVTSVSQLGLGVADGQLHVPVRVPLFLYEYLNRYRLERSDDSNQTWAEVTSPSPSQTYLPYQGAWQRQWTMDGTGAPDSASYRINALPPL